MTSKTNALNYLATPQSQVLELVSIELTTLHLSGTYSDRWVTVLRIQSSNQKTINGNVFINLYIQDEIHLYFMRFKQSTTFDQSKYTLDECTTLSNN